MLPTDVTLLAEVGGNTDTVDVVYYDADYSTLCGFDWHPDDPGDSGTAWTGGLYQCISLSGAKCQHAHVSFDTSVMDTISSDGAKTWACHETGHTLGLTHRDGGCMPSTVPANQHFFTDHDRVHINGVY